MNIDNSMDSTRIVGILLDINGHCLTIIDREGPMESIKIHLFYGLESYMVESDGCMFEIGYHLWLISLRSIRLILSLMVSRLVVLKWIFTR